MGFVAQPRMGLATLYLRVLCDADGIGRSNSREAVEDCSTDFDLGCLTVKGACHDPLTEQLEAVHFRVDEAAAMITAPLLPDGASKPFDRTQRFIAGSRARAGGQPCPGHPPSMVVRCGGPE